MLTQFPVSQHTGESAATHMGYATGEKAEADASPIPIRMDGWMPSNGREIAIEYGAVKSMVRVI